MTRTVCVKVYLLLSFVTLATASQDPPCENKSLSPVTEKIPKEFCAERNATCISDGKSTFICVCHNSSLQFLDSVCTVNPCHNISLTPDGKAKQTPQEYCETTGAVCSPLGTNDFKCNCPEGKQPCSFPACMNSTLSPIRRIPKNDCRQKEAACVETGKSSYNCSCLDSEKVIIEDKCRVPTCQDKTETPGNEWWKTPDEYCEERNATCISERRYDFQCICLEKDMIFENRKCILDPCENRSITPGGQTELTPREYCAKTNATCRFDSSTEFRCSCGTTVDEKCLLPACLNSTLSKWADPNRDCLSMGAVCVDTGKFSFECSCLDEKKVVFQGRCQMDSCENRAQTPGGQTELTPREYCAQTNATCRHNSSINFECRCDTTVDEKCLIPACLNSTLSEWYDPNRDCLSMGAVCVDTGKFSFECSCPVKEEVVIQKRCERSPCTTERRISGKYQLPSEYCAEMNTTCVPLNTREFTCKCWKSDQIFQNGQCIDNPCENRELTPEGRSWQTPYEYCLERNTTCYSDEKFAIGCKCADGGTFWHGECLRYESGCHNKSLVPGGRLKQTPKAYCEERNGYCQSNGAHRFVCGCQYPTVKSDLLNDVCIEQSETLCNRKFLTPDGRTWQTPKEYCEKRNAFCDDSGPEFRCRCTDKNQIFVSSAEQCIDMKKQLCEGPWKYFGATLLLQSPNDYCLQINASCVVYNGFKNFTCVCWDSQQRFIDGKCKEGPTYCENRKITLGGRSHQTPKEYCMERNALCIDSKDGYESFYCYCLQPHEVFSTQHETCIEMYKPPCINIELTPGRLSGYKTPNDYCYDRKATCAPMGKDKFTCNCWNKDQTFFNDQCTGANHSSCDNKALTPGGRNFQTPSQYCEYRKSTCVEKGYNNFTCDCLNAEHGFSTTEEKCIDRNLPACDNKNLTPRDRIFQTPGQYCSYRAATCQSTTKDTFVCECWNSQHTFSTEQEKCQEETKK